MRVQNPGGRGVFVQQYGVVPGGEEATVRESDAVKSMIKAGTLKEPKTGSGGAHAANGGDGS